MHPRVLSPAFIGVILLGEAARDGVDQESSQSERQCVVELQRLEAPIYRGWAAERTQHREDRRLALGMFHHASESTSLELPQTPSRTPTDLTTGVELGFLKACRQHECRRRRRLQRGGQQGIRRRSRVGEDVFNHGFSTNASTAIITAATMIPTPQLIPFWIAETEA